MKKALILTAVLLSFALAAPAQMTGHHPSTPGTGSGSGSGSGTMPGDREGMGPMQFAVVNDGTVVVIDHDDAAATTPADSLVAYNASGVKTWTLKLDGRAMGLQASASQFYVLSVNEDGRTLAAVSGSGAILWKVALN